MEKVLNIYKPIAQTPYHLIQRLKEDSRFENVPLGYAGRLDPMADGVLIVLVGEENKKRKKYERLTKEYEFSMACGVTTDTYDILGKVVSSVRSLPSSLPENLTKVVPSHVTTFQQPYPPYSSVRVQGHPLFYWARKGEMGSIAIPEKTVSVTSLEFSKFQWIPRKEILKEIYEKVSHVTGDFRQEEILRIWEQNEKNLLPELMVAHGKIICSSGTYVRSVIHSLGADLGCGAVTFSLTRTAVGPFVIQKSMRL